MSKYDEMRKELKHSIIDLDADHYRLDEFMRVIDEIFVKYRNEIEQPKIGGWIPCSERLPEENQSVIACFAHGTVTELRFYDKKFHGIYDYDEKVIVAWQPLPEPYHG